MAPAVPLLDEPEALVQRDRGLVVREDVELELGHAHLARPAHGGLEQRASDPVATMAGGDHETQIGDMEARRMWVARDGEPADEPLGRLRHEHRRVRRAAGRPKVAALLGCAAPLLGGDQPALRLCAHLTRELDQTRGIAGDGPPDLERLHSITTP